MIQVASCVTCDVRPASWVRKLFAVREGGRSKNGTCLELNMLVLLVMSSMFEVCVCVCVHVLNIYVLLLQCVKMVTCCADFVILGVCLSQRLASSRAAMLLVAGKGSRDSLDLLGGTVFGAADLAGDVICILN